MFQNTISYGTFGVGNGNIILVGGGLAPVVTSAYNYIENLVKGISTTVLGTGGVVKVSQDGAYYVDFSFIASGGDNKTYTLKPFVNNLEQGGMDIKFYQQATSQKYEVSGSYIFDLNAGDELSFKIYVLALPSTTFETKDVKLTIINLQQLGVH